MVRKTRRKGGGKKAETRYSPLARSLMVHRIYENVTLPQLKRDFEAAQAFDADLARQASTMATPEGREALRRVQVEHAKEVLKGVKDTTDAAATAKKTLRKEFASSGGKRKSRRNGKFLRRHTRRTRKA